MRRLVSQDREHDDIVDLSQHSWYFVYAPNSDPKDESSSSDTRKPDFAETDESTAAGEVEQDIFDDGED